MVLPVCEPGIIVVFMGNRTVADLFRAAITDIRGFIKSWAEFFLKVLTGLIAGGAGSAFHTAQDNLAAGIGFLAVIPMDAEVMGIIKGSFVIPVRQPMCLDLFGNGGRILAEKPGDIFKGCAFVQFILDVNTVVKGKMFLVAWNIFTHKVPPSTAVRRRDNHTTFL